jgi:hypothetical protein
MLQGTYHGIALKHRILKHQSREKAVFKAAQSLIVDIVKQGDRAAVIVYFKAVKKIVDISGDKIHRVHPAFVIPEKLFDLHIDACLPLHVNIFNPDHDKGVPAVDHLKETLNPLRVNIGTIRQTIRIRIDPYHKNLSGALEAEGFADKISGEPPPRRIINPYVTEPVCFRIVHIVKNIRNASFFGQGDNFFYTIHILAEKGRGVKAVPYFPFQRLQIVFRVKIGDPEKVDLIVKRPDIRGGIPDASLNIVPYKGRKGRGKGSDDPGLVPHKDLGSPVGYIAVFFGIIKDTFFQLPGNVSEIIKCPAHGNKGNTEFSGNIFLSDVHY